MSVFRTAVFIMAASFSMAWPDTVELKTGERVEGTFKQATSASVVMEVAGQPVTMPLEKWV